MNDLTDKEKKVISVLAEKGLKTYYELYFRKQENVASSSTVWKALKRLREKGLIEVKRIVPFKKIERVRKKYYGLTFKGILYSISAGIIAPWGAEEARTKNRTELPLMHEIKQIKEKIESSDRFGRAVANHDSVMHVLLVETHSLWEEIMQKHSSEIYSFIVAHTNLNLYNEDAVMYTLFDALRLYATHEFSRALPPRYRAMRLMREFATRSTRQMFHKLFKNMQKQNE